MNKTRIASAAFAAIVVLALLTCFCACTQAQELPDWAFDSLYAADASRAEGSDVRVMSVNMLVHMESWGGEPVEPRAQLAEKFFEHYAPDVVALQEMCGDFSATAKSLRWPTTILFFATSRFNARES